MKLLRYELKYVYALWLTCSVIQGKWVLRARLPVPRVWNGVPADLGEFPYQVGLMQPVGTNVYAAFCGGAIIGKSRVLTAAHCIAPEDERTFCQKLFCVPKPVRSRKEISSFRIVAGNIETTLIRKDDTTSQWRKIHKYTYPKKYTFPERDICVIITDKPFTFNNIVSSLPYASRDLEYGGLVCMSSGFGLLTTFQQFPRGSKQLMWVPLALMTKTDCSGKHGLNMNDFICTHNDEEDVAQGDSGGPLVCTGTGDPREGPNGIIVGVVSGETDDGNFFTRVSTQREFLDSAHIFSSCPQFCIFIGFAIIIFY